MLTPDANVRGRLFLRFHLDLLRGRTPQTDLTGPENHFHTRSGHRDSFLQFFDPIQDDVDLGRGRSAVIGVRCLDHEESLAIRTDIPHAPDFLEILPAKQLSRRRSFLKAGGLVAVTTTFPSLKTVQEGEVQQTRVESDTMGPVDVPAESHIGAQTQRAVENFPISGIRFPRRFIRALGLIKGAASQVNEDLGLLRSDHADAIIQAAQEVVDGRWDDEFVLDIFQTGSGTSTNMNANEVISSRANELLGGRMGDRQPVRPNDEVNKCQSSNDVVPTAIHLAALEGCAKTFYRRWSSSPPASKIRLRSLETC